MTYDTKFKGKQDGIIRHSPKVLDGERPLDTGVVQDGIIHNQEILYGCSSQTRINFLWDTPMCITFAGEQEVWSTSKIIADYTIPVSLTPDGTFMPLWVKIAFGGISISNKTSFDIEVTINEINNRGTGADQLLAQGSTTFTTNTGGSWRKINNDEGGAALWARSRDFRSYLTRRSFDSDVAGDSVETVYLRILVNYVPNVQTNWQNMRQLRFHGLWVRECAFYTPTEL